MQCREFDNSMHAVLDERQCPESNLRLAAHAAECERCRAMLHAQRAVLIAVSRLSRPRTSQDFSRRVVAAATHAAGPADNHYRRRTWLAAGRLSLAAAAAVLLGLGIIWQAHQHRETWAGLGQRSRQSITILPSRPGAGRVEMSGGQWLIEAPRLSQHLRNCGGAIGDFVVTIPQAVERLDEVDHMAPGFRGLRVSLGVIWDTLCRTIPGSHSDFVPDERHRPRTSRSWFDALRVA